MARCGEAKKIFTPNHYVVYVIYVVKALPGVL
jgi:hypothetical protein